MLNHLEPEHTEDIPCMWNTLKIFHVSVRLHWANHDLLLTYTWEEQSRGKKLPWLRLLLLWSFLFDRRMRGRCLHEHITSSGRPPCMTWTSTPPASTPRSAATTGRHRHHRHHHHHPLRKTTVWVCLRGYALLCLSHVLVTKCSVELAICSGASRTLWDKGWENRMCLILSSCVNTRRCEQGGFVHWPSSSGDCGKGCCPPGGIDPL